MRENADLKKLRIWTLFMLCINLVEHDKFFKNFHQCFMNLTEIISDTGSKGTPYVALDEAM